MRLFYYSFIVILNFLLVKAAVNAPHIGEDCLTETGHRVLVIKKRQLPNAEQGPLYALDNCGGVDFPKFR
jgi:hypothetical protein